MRTTTSYASLIATLISFTSASPLSRAQLATTRDVATSVAVTLTGATPEAIYTLSVPLDTAWGEYTSTAPYDPKKLSISHVDYDHKIAICYFYGVDEVTAVAATLVESAWQLGPPQVVTGVWCARAC